jgi:hypothetical protein
MNTDSKFGVNRQAQYQRGNTVTVTHSLVMPEPTVATFNDYYNDAFDQTPNSVSVEDTNYDNYFGVFYIAPADMTLIDAYVSITASLSGVTIDVRKFQDGETPSAVTGVSIVTPTTISLAEVNTVVQMKLAPYIGNFSPSLNDSRGVVRKQRIGVYPIGAGVGDIEGNFVLTLLFQEV